MSSSNFRPSSFSTVALIVAAVVLSACGFRPLYGQNAATGAASVNPHLAAVHVKFIHNRDGQMMRTALQRRLNAPRDTKPLYQLDVTLKESVGKLAIEKNAFATRANLSLTASYRLINIADGRLLNSGDPVVVASFNILSSDYATLAGEADARVRAIDSLANDIYARLAVYYSGPGALPSGVSSAAPQP